MNVLKQKKERGSIPYLDETWPRSQRRVKKKKGGEDSTFHFFEFRLSSDEISITTYQRNK